MNPVIFLRVGWMDFYRGINAGDTISGGGGYVKQHGFGHEIFNFQAFRSRVYGYFQPRASGGRWKEARVKLERLGASPTDHAVTDIDAVWVATSRYGGAYVIGWYKNAILYRNWQAPPDESGRQHLDVDCGYFVSARAEDAVLLPADERTFQVPQSRKGSFGQANIWYADNLPTGNTFLSEVRGLLDAKRRSNSVPAEYAEKPQPDIFKRQLIERRAVEVTIQYYSRLGYSITSVEKDNVGWDLDAVLDRCTLKLEVKGLSGEQISVGLTPNEYSAMLTHRESYRLCVVRDALDEPRLDVFSYSAEIGSWADRTGRELEITESVAAKCSSV